MYKVRERLLAFDSLWTSLVIGVSLSEPHTSVTALQRVCMYVCAWPYTEHLNERTDFKFAHVLKQIHVW